MLRWKPVGISFFFCEHKNGILGKLKLVDEKVTHALGVIDATFELMPRVSIRNPTDHRPFSTVGVGRCPGRSMIVRGGRRRRVGGRSRWLGCGREGSRVSDVGNGFTDGTTDGSGTLRKLQRGVAAGAVDQHRRRVIVVHASWPWRRIHYSKSQRLIPKKNYLGKKGNF